MVSRGGRCWSDVACPLETSSRIFGLLAESRRRDAAVSKWATIVSPVRRSRSSVRNRVESGAPSATAPPTACISRSRCPGMTTSVESERIDWVADTACDRDLPQEMMDEARRGRADAPGDPPDPVLVRPQRVGRRQVVERQEAAMARHRERLQRLGMRR